MYDVNIDLLTTPTVPLRQLEHFFQLTGANYWAACQALLTIEAELYRLSILLVADWSLQSCLDTHGQPPPLYRLQLLSTLVTASVQVRARAGHGECCLLLTVLPTDRVTQSHSDPQTFHQNS